MRLFSFLYIALGSLLPLGAVTWTYPPVQISTLGVDASEPQVGVDNSGNVVAVWNEGGKIQAKNIPFGGSWGPVTTLANAGSSSPRLVVDQFGNATAIWIQGSSVQAAHQPTNGSWTVTPTISSPGASSPDLCVDTSGDVIAVWVRNGFIESSTYSGGSWQNTPDVISATGADTPEVAVGSNLVVAVWHQVVSSVDTIFSNQKTIGGSWGSATAISSDTQNSVYPHVDVDSAGNAAAVWFRYNVDGTGTIYSNVFAQSSYQPFGGSWEIPVDLSKGGIYDPALLVSAIAFDGSGNMIAGWNTSYNGATFLYESSIRLKGETWGNSSALVGPDQFAYSFALDCDSYGHAVQVFMSTDPTSPTAIDIMAKKKNIDSLNQGWSLTRALFSVGDTNGYPTLGVQSANNVTYLASAWLNYNGTNTVIYATTGFGNNYPPPTNLAVSQEEVNENIFIQYNNKFTWSPSVNPSTVGYQIYRNGIFLGSVSSLTNQYVDVNQVQSAHVEYGVAAFDRNYEQSEIITVTIN